jgi:hypothetical protein
MPYPKLLNGCDIKRKLLSKIIAYKPIMAKAKSNLWRIHMKKLVLILMLMLAAMAVFPAYAQDEEDSEMVSCSPEEFNEATEEISTGINEFVESLSSEEEMDAAALTEAVISLEGFSTGFWEGYNEAAEEDLCIELMWYGFNAGLVIDDLLITTQLSAIAHHEAEAGNTENADAFTELAQTRAAMLEANVTALNDGITAISEGGELSFDYVECSDEELEAAEAALEELAGAYMEIGDLSAEDEDVDFAALTAGYAELSNGFWTEMMPSLPACFDAQQTAFGAGLIIDESVIVSGLYYLAAAEAELGNEEAATVLLESADARAENLMASLEELEGSEEEE